ncbi:MAG: NAD(+)/NADH kinase [Opitutales bacterium]|nr:NAD(+)/NADH kinase [Opitutales bacterium]
MNFQNLAFVVNLSKKGSPSLAESLVSVAKEFGCSTRLTDSFPVSEDFLEGMDACCVIGGDGTLLHLAPQASLRQVPLIGFNRGNLGFLTTFGAEEAEKELRRILSGHYQKAPRQMLRCEINGETHWALNDFVIKEKSNAHLILLDVWVDDTFVAEYHSDGLIFATPTGSTAYNLSASGPIIEPSAKVFTMTPISPHTLSNRSIIFPSGSRLRVKTAPNSRSQALLLRDGKTLDFADNTLDFTLTAQNDAISFLQGTDYDHFSVLRQKLGWMGPHRETT